MASVPYILHLTLAKRQGSDKVPGFSTGGLSKLSHRDTGLFFTHEGCLLSHSSLLITLTCAQHTGLKPALPSCMDSNCLPSGI